MAKIYRCVVRCVHSNGTLVEPSFHYQTDLPGGDPLATEPSAGDVANKVWAHWGGQFVAATSDDIHLNELVALEEVVPPAIGSSGSQPIGQPGGYPLAGGKLSHALVPVLDKHTATRSRSARGWAFLGAPMREADCAGDNWDQTTAWWSALVDLASHLDDSFTMNIDPLSATLHPIVYSRRRHRAGLTPYTFNITSVTPNPQSRWLKSRLSSP